jgi:hypothetical protein
MQVAVNAHTMTKVISHQYHHDIRNVSFYMEQLLAQGLCSGMMQASMLKENTQYSQPEC